MLRQIIDKFRAWKDHGKPIYLYERKGPITLLCDECHEPIEEGEFAVILTTSEKIVYKEKHISCLEEFEKERLTRKLLLGNAELKELPISKVTTF